ncbi:DUF4184 family protein [Caldalkalibacillus mannanilyticus]|uniref:DUF4184 family protein n=1 Tax=Caldalkalibacillus mannanilyticus TaxID=1418 RepID=UPI000467F1F7|nr:DUF4184 family protein [Caldalkalibacillus mannanilyticus]
MPFTFSHPIFAFPLKWISPKYLSLTGLVLGSMAPDFEYFLHLEPYGGIGHTVSGLFIQAIPLSILLAYIFHYIVKKSLVVHLPAFCHIDQRAYNLLGEWKLSSLRDWIVFLMSVVIGFISHVTADAFTHAPGYFVLRYAILQEVFLFNLPLFKLLQYGFSILGIIIIAGMVLWILLQTSPSARNMTSRSVKQKQFYWMVVFASSFLVTMTKLLVTESKNLLGIIVVAPISGFFLGLILASILSIFIEMKRWRT